MKRNKTEEILSSLDGIQRAGADPYLYSKILNRLAEPDSNGKRLAWSLAVALAVVLVLNLFTVFSLGSTSRNQPGDNATVIANEYGINLPSYY